MNFKEIAEAKKCALVTSDWDAYQVIIRTCLKTLKKEEAARLKTKKSGVSRGPAETCSSSV